MSWIAVSTAWAQTATPAPPSIAASGYLLIDMHSDRVLVEKNAGAGSGFADEAYVKAGAKIVETPKEIFDAADMVMHVKEPLPPEYDLIREGQIVFTYLHLAADEPQTRALINSKAVCIAYETIQKADGSLPLLAPMSEVAGRMAVQAAAHCLEREAGGAGILYHADRVHLDWFARFRERMVSPEVHADRRVTFRVKAPNATSVLLQSGPILNALGSADGAVGFYEVDEEDFALCEFISTSKINIQKIVRDGINLMIKEMN